MTQDEKQEGKVPPVRASQKDLSLEVSSLMSGDHKKDLKEHKRPTISFEVTAMMMQDDDEDFLVRKPATEFTPEPQDDFEPIDELSASMSRYQRDLISQEQEISEPVIKSVSDISYLESNVTAAPSAPKYQPLANGFAPGNVLEQICKVKLEHVAKQKTMTLESRLREIIHLIPVAKGFISAINAKVSIGKNALIAEIKKASPSKGIIRADFEPALIAKAYEEGGAACISVLTDIPYFQGKDEYINVVKRMSSLPVLRKDFILDPYQVVESRALGADCILLIMAALSDEQAIMLEEQAVQLGLDVLVEVHNEQELFRALKLKTKLIGINNRDLKTLKIDIATTEILAPLVPSDRIVVCESGIYSPEDIERINDSKVRAFLVGESLMVQQDVKAATMKLLGN
ncbi:MAG: indole-3-glycerol-phosphate synthase [Rickettsiaceae bacterium]|jgi:indole-3-glycerol phosphate synthase|nr:indole-3-glycerol-phosphate synthase [Rickettsiaceae bacterium]